MWIKRFCDSVRLPKYMFSKRRQFCNCNISHLSTVREQCSGTLLIRTPALAMLMGLGQIS